MNWKERFEKENDRQSSEAKVTAFDALVSSQCLIDDSMDNIEAMLKLLMSDPKNITLSKHSADMTQKLTTVPQTVQAIPKKTKSVNYALSADSVIRPARQLIQNIALALKKPKVKKYPSPITPYVFVAGPVRIQTTQQIGRQSPEEIFIDEVMELYGSGIKYPSKDLISIKPRILKSRSTTQNCAPTTVQSVQVGHNYIRIERKSNIKLPAIGSHSPVKSKELVEFGSETDCNREKDVSSEKKSKSEGSLLRAPIFNLIGPLVVTVLQNTVHCVNGSYKIQEEIELRADRSTANPKVTVIPFLRKVSDVSKWQKQEVPFKYQEEILVGNNVMLFKRIIEVKPMKKHMESFLLSEERNYVTDKTDKTSHSSTQVITLRKRKKKLPEIPSGFATSDVSKLNKKISLSSVDFKDNNGRIAQEGELLKTAESSTDMSSSGKKMIETFDQFRIIRQSKPLRENAKPTQSKETEITKRKYAKPKVGQSPTDAFLKADLLTARQSISTRKPFDSKEIESISTESSSVNSRSKSHESVKSDNSSNQSHSFPQAYILRTARSITNQSNRKALSPEIYPMTPPPSPRCQKLKRKRSVQWDDAGENTAVPPEDLSSSSSHSLQDQSSDEDKKKNSSTLPSSDSRKEPPSLLGSSRSLTPEIDLNNSKAFVKNKSLLESKKNDTPFKSLCRQELSGGIMKSQKPSGAKTRSTEPPNVSILRNSFQHGFNKDRNQMLLQSRSAETPTRQMTQGCLSKQQKEKIPKICSMELPKKQHDYYASNSQKSKIIRDAIGRKQEPKPTIEKLPFKKYPPQRNLERQSPLPPSTIRINNKSTSSEAAELKKTLKVKDKIPCDIDEKASPQALSRFQRFATHQQTQISNNSAYINSAENSLRQTSLISVAAESEDVRSFSDQTPTYWFEKYIAASKSKQTFPNQKSLLVTPVHDEIMQLPTAESSPTSSNSESEESEARTALSAVSGTSTQTNASSAGKTAITLQSEAPYNLTVRINMNVKVKNITNDEERESDLRPKRIVVKGREVYRN